MKKQKLKQGSSAVVTEKKRKALIDMIIQADEDFTARLYAIARRMEREGK